MSPSTDRPSCKVFEIGPDGVIRHGAKVRLLADQMALLEIGSSGYGGGRVIVSFFSGLFGDTLKYASVVYKPGLKAFLTEATCANATDVIIALRANPEPHGILWLDAFGNEPKSSHVLAWGRRTDDGRFAEEMIVHLPADYSFQRVDGGPLPSHAFYHWNGQNLFDIAGLGK